MRTISSGPSMLNLQLTLHRTIKNAGSIRAQTSNSCCNPTSWMSSHCHRTRRAISATKTMDSSILLFHFFLSCCSSIVHKNREETWCYQKDQKSRILSGTRQDWFMEGRLQKKKWWWFKTTALNVATGKRQNKSASRGGRKRTFWLNHHEGCQ